MRIIAGRYKGRNLQTVRDLSVRPATGRVRQTLFDMLEHRLLFDGLRVLDLYAGSGSLGFEALSRGAAQATFIERDPEALRYLEENARMLGCTADVEILSLDAARFLSAPSAPFGLIFADPPYANDETASLPGMIFRGGYLASNGLLLIEHPPTLAFPEDAGYAPGPVKKFGRTVVTFFHHTEQES